MIKSLTNSRIVITGIGPISSVGIGNKKLINGLRHGVTGIQEKRFSFGGDILAKPKMHIVDNFDINDFGIERDRIERIRDWKGGKHDMDLLYMLAASKLALDDAKIVLDDIAIADLSVVVTHENPGLENLLWRFFKETHRMIQKKDKLTIKDYFNNLYKKVVKSGYETQSFMALFHITRTLGIHNYSIFNNNACASGLFSLEIAKDIIRTKKAKKVLVVAGDCPDIFKYLWFKDLNMLSIDGLTRPFDSSRSGFLLGAGAVGVVLEDYASASNRGAQIYCEYLGGGFVHESWGITYPKIGNRYYINTIKMALRNAKISASEVDLICAHGVATSIGDHYEAQAIEHVFKKNHPKVTALKPFIGHNLGGSSLLELATLILAMKNKYIPEILNTKKCDPKFQLNLVLKPIRSEVDVIMKICCAFAGYDAAVVLKRLTK